MGIRGRRVGWDKGEERRGGIRGGGKGGGMGEEGRVRIKLRREEVNLSN